MGGVPEPPLTVGWPLTGHTRALLATGRGAVWVPESGSPRARPSPSRAGVTRNTLAVLPAVLRGLIEVRSPHLEELLAALFSATSAFAGSRPIVVVSSLLLQDKEEPPAPGKQDADGGR